jgi:hypothetical protein
MGTLHDVIQILRMGEEAPSTVGWYLLDKVQFGRADIYVDAIMPGGRDDKKISYHRFIADLVLLSIIS